MTETTIDGLPDDDADMDIDVCQHCGGYFAWTDGQRAAAIKWGWKPGGNTIRPQRCIRCLTDECWIERDDRHNN